MFNVSSLAILIPLSILAAVVTLEIVIVLRAKSILIEMILPLALGAVSMYYLFFFHEEYPTMKGGMYGTFFLVCFLVSLVAFGVTRLIVNKAETRID